MAKFITLHRWDDKSKYIINKEEVVSVYLCRDNKRTVVSLGDNSVAYVSETLDEVQKN